MKALILAAGLGTRLAPITDKLPKSLVPVNGKPILVKQIENLLENNVTDITIVSGYKSDILKKKIHDIWPEIKIVESVDYANTNNMYSAYLGIKKMFPDNIYDSFLMMNADVFYDASVIAALLNDSSSNAIVVDMGRYLDESMKVVENDGRITSISKQISENEALGTSIDVYKLSSEGGKKLFNHCVDYIENKKELKLWSEVALNDTLEDVEFHACPLQGRWLEIDNHDDLAAAEELFAK
ncbi:sugar phosphate nucleotidyltransferase [Selenomonas ruminantium]|uniref:phosphocholine cytidylyltransferase family protein n=1 Tax=Selenomonas ruminantium TaxID=971 RepID=UPI000420F464|nr:phosphocholine cytidylyltransferase family protein [Selenomonas ruminantium]